MGQVNITHTIGRAFDWQIANLAWSDARRATIFTRFWSNVQRGQAKDCWPWRGYVSDRGYGVFGIGQQRIRAHRFAWLASRGDIPIGAVLCHHCDETTCVNPGHMFIGTQRDNHLDSVRKGRKRAWGLQKLNAEQVYEIRRLSAIGQRRTDVAQRFGVAANTVSGIVHRKTWAHLDEAS